jgi:type IV pilus assembly protein PilV
MRKRQSGVSLIEVLTSMLILAVGMLGMVAVQTSSLRNLQSAQSQGTAAQLAYDIADRMRANPGQVVANTYNHTFTPASDGEGGDSGPDCTAQICSTEQLAAYDLAEWQAQLVAQLPSVRANIARTSTAGVGGALTDDFQVTVLWDDDRSGSTGTECDPAKRTEADLDCWQVTVSF